MIMAKPAVNFCNYFISLHAIEQTFLHFSFHFMNKLEVAEQKNYFPLVSKQTFEKTIAPCIKCSAL